MKMIRRKTLDTRVERQIITGMIVSDKFLTEVQTIYTQDCLTSGFTKTIAGWCNKYYHEYKKAPGKMIEDIFQEHKKFDLEEHEAVAIEEFLAGLSEEYEEGNVFNDEYILKKAEQHFRLSSLENVRTELTKCLVGDRVEDGEQIIARFRRITRIETVGVDPFLDGRKIIEALDEDSGDAMFKMYGALGNTLGTFERGHLLGVVGSSGVGKSWWLMAIALRALFSGFKVLFVSLEMSEKQMIRRIQHWATGLPNEKWAGDLLIPVFDCKKNQTGECEERNRAIIVDEDTGFKPYDYKDIVRIIKRADQAPDNRRSYTPCVKCKGTRDYEAETWFKLVNKKALDIQAAMKKHHLLSRTSTVRPNRFKLVQFPSGGLTMTGLKTYLHNLEYYDDFVPDVIVTDYADKFAAEKQSEFRHGIHEVWEGHKALAQERNILVATGSQSNTARTGADIQQGSWAEDIRKLNLIDVGFAINQTPEEKRQCFYRCGIVKQRHDDFDLLGEVIVLNQLKIGRPYIDSHFGYIKKKK